MTRHHLAILTAPGITLASTAMTLDEAQELRATLEQRLRQGTPAVLRVPLAVGYLPLNVRHAVMWEIVPADGTPTWGRHNV